MRVDWKLLYLPLIGFLIILSVLAYMSYCWYGFSFWETFYSQSLATVFGVTLSALIALIIWRYQQRMLKEHKLENLNEALKIEVNENLNRLADTEIELDKYEKENQHMVNGSMIMRGYNIAGITIEFLRTVAMTEFLKPDNRLLIKDIKFEDKIDWLLWRCNLFNRNLSVALKEFEEGLNSDKNKEEAFPKLKSTILQGFHSLLGFMHSIDKRLGGNFFYPKKQ